MKSANAYQRANGIYFCSFSRTTAGVWIATSPFFRVESKKSYVDLQSAALAVLNASQASVAHPKQEEWKSVGAGLLELAGAKTWKTFMKDTMSVIRLEAANGMIRIIPYRNLGPKDGFQEMPADKIVELPFDASPSQFGAAFEEALNRCQ
jgi:hypothetical protein